LSVQELGLYAAGVSSQGPGGEEQKIRKEVKPTAKDGKIQEIER
jgi:hypothetical protein